MRVLKVVNDKATVYVTGQIVKQDDSAMPGSLLATFTITTWTVETDTVVVDHRNVLNANGGVVNEDGTFEIVLEPADSTLSGTSDERRRVLLEWTYSGGARRGSDQGEYRVSYVPHRAA